MLNTDRVYIIHYTKLVNRKTHIDNLMKKYNIINYEYILDFDKEVLTEEQIMKSYQVTQESFANTIAKVYKGSTPSRQHLGEISCCFKHREAIRKIAENCESHGLIIEDDIITEEDFGNLFNSYLSRTPDDWDAIFMGSCCGLSAENKKESQVAHLKSHPATKCADAYLIKKDMAKKITETVKNFNSAWDWELAYQLYLHNAKVYWWEPALVSQGSQNGLFASALR